MRRVRGLNPSQRLAAEERVLRPKFLSVSFGCSRPGEALPSTARTSRDAELLAQFLPGGWPWPQDICVDPVQRIEDAAARAKEMCIEKPETQQPEEPAADSFPILRREQEATAWLIVGLIIALLIASYVSSLLIDRAP